VDIQDRLQAEDLSHAGYGRGTGRNAPLRHPERRSTPERTSRPNRAKVHTVVVRNNGMRDKLLVLVLAAAASNAAGAGEIYRCVGANGDVSYTNIACPAKSHAETVATYQPDHYVPPPAPAYDASAHDAENSAEEARAAALQAREAALDARIAYEQAQEEQAADSQPAEPIVYSPLWVPAYFPSAPRFRGGRGHSRHDPVLHLNGPQTPVRSPNWSGAAGDGHAPRFRGRR
jgi:Domain of unknown function (DUF4124)